MTRVIVGLDAGNEPGLVADTDATQLGEPARTIDLGDAGTVELLPQELEFDGTRWYSVDFDDSDDSVDVDGIVAALLETPGVDSAYVQADEGPPG